jgi:signal peptidase I
MQCASCGFENMPGSEACARCASSLSIATAVMDVHPPRAGKLSKKIRRVMPKRALYAVREELVTTRAATRALQQRVWGGLTWGEKPPWAVRWRSVVPGWSHFYAGYRVRGHAYLWCFLACLVPGLLMMGTTAGSFLLGLAFSVHASAVVDVFNFYLPKGSFGQLMLRSLWVTALVAAVVYAPIWWLGSWVISLRTLQTTMGPFVEGDVVIMNQWVHSKDWPHVGQVVLYRIPQNQEETQHGANGHGRRIVIYDGERIDRVIALGGDEVVIDNGILKVNGEPARYWPLNPNLLPRKFKVRVPHDSVLIFPSTTPNLEPNSSEWLWRVLSCVPKSQVEATVYMRWQPMSRMWIIR